MRQIFLDTETTGLNAETGDRIVEIGCVEMLNRRLSGRNLHIYLNPQRASHEDNDSNSEQPCKRSQDCACRHRCLLEVAGGDARLIHRFWSRQFHRSHCEY